MKRQLLLLLGLTPMLVMAQTNETVTLGTQYADQVWYDLETGTQYTRSVNEWELAFEIQGWEASIKVNTQKAGVKLFRAPYSISQWNALDTAGINTWTALHDRDGSWALGALNLGVTTDSLDLGWGNYNFITHVIIGDSLFVMQLANGDWKKLRIDDLAGGEYHFTYASLDGTNEVSGTIAKAMYATKNFAYWSMENDAAIDREPASSDWDLTFTRYIGFIPTPYGVTGVLSNKGVKVQEAAGVPVANSAWDNTAMQNDINVIGFDWKTFNMTTFQWEIQDSLSYFAKSKEGNIWKLVFTGFGGSSTGDIMFTKEEVSAVNVVELSTLDLSIFPNPSSSGVIHISVPVEFENSALVVRDMAGRILQQKRIQRAGGMQTLDLQELSDGVLLLEVLNDSSRAIGRVIIQRN